MFKITNPHVCGEDNHDFQARYDKIHIEPKLGTNLLETIDLLADRTDCDENANDLAEAAAKLFVAVDTIYVKDVCRYCGLEVKR